MYALYLVNHSHYEIASNAIIETNARSPNISRNTVRL